jgi:hypothetical protein
MRERINGIERECTLQKYQRLCHAIWHPGIDVGLGLEDKIIGVETVRPLTSDALDFGPPQARLDCAHYV